MCGEERDLVASGNGVYGGGGPRLAVVAVAVAIVVVTVESRGSTTGGGDGVKRKGRLGKAAAVLVEDARLRGGGWVLWPDEDARMRTVGVILLRG